MPDLAVACPSASECTAIDQSVGAVTFNPTSPGTPTPLALDAGAQSFVATGVACPASGRRTVVGTPVGSTGASPGMDGDGQEVTLTSGGPAGAIDAGTEYTGLSVGLRGGFAIPGGQAKSVALGNVVRASQVIH